MLWLAQGSLYRKHPKFVFMEWLLIIGFADCEDRFVGFLGGDKIERISQCSLEKFDNLFNHWNTTIL